MTTASFLATYTFDFGPVIEAFPKLLYGLWITIALAVATMLISLPLGLATAFARLSSFRPLSGVAHAYVDLFRATPVLVQIFVIAFGIGPALGLKVDVFVLGAIALALNVGAFLSEIFRGAIQSIDRGQREAAIVMRSCSVVHGPSPAREDAPAGDTLVPAVRRQPFERRQPRSSQSAVNHAKRPFRAGPPDRDPEADGSGSGKLESTRRRLHDTAAPQE